MGEWIPARWHLIVSREVIGGGGTVTIGVGAVVGDSGDDTGGGVDTRLGRARSVNGYYGGFPDMPGAARCYRSGVLLIEGEIAAFLASGQPLIALILAPREKAAFTTGLPGLVGIRHDCIYGVARQLSDISGANKDGSTVVISETGVEIGSSKKGLSYCLFVSAQDVSDRNRVASCSHRAAV